MGRRPERVAVTAPVDLEPRRWMTALWLVTVAAGQVVALYQVIRLFVNRRHGQLLDTIALGGNWIGTNHVSGIVNTVLSAMSVVAVVFAAGVVAFIALARRRAAVGLAALLLIAGATLTSQLLKNHLIRPELGVDPERASAGNSLPSGHATVAASVAVALVLVLPPKARGPGAVVGAVYAGLVGVATMSAGWHRPSDSIAAFLIVGIWAAVAALVLLITPQVGLLMRLPSHRGLSARGRIVAASPGASHWITVALLGVVGAAMLAAAVITIDMTDQVTVPPEQLPYERLFVAYAGSAIGIAGAACLMMALVLATVHLVVPERTVVPDAEPALPAP